MSKTFLLSPLFLLFSSLNCMNFADYNLTLDQKIGQLFMVAAVSDEGIAQNCIQNKSYRMDKEYTEDLITDYHIGGIIYLGKSNAEKQIALTCHYQCTSSIPLLIGQDLEPGRVGASRLPEFFNFPSNKALSKINNLEYTQEIGNKIGNICKQLGVHINFAPVADVNNNPASPVINNRSFSNNPDIVAKHAIAFAQGLTDTNVVACAKHFPGHGDTDVDSHHDLPVVAHDIKRLNAIELHPFKELIAANIPAIMIGHLAVPALEPIKNLPATFSKAIVTDFLKNTLGFKGLIITDALDMGAITNTYSNGQAELQALLAGNDILLCPVDVPAAIAAIKQAITDQLITEKEIDVHVEKILAIKHTLFNF